MQIKHGPDLFFFFFFFLHLIIILLQFGFLLNLFYKQTNHNMMTYQHISNIDLNINEFIKKLFIKAFYVNCTLVVAIADLKMIRIKIIFKRILQKHKTRFFKTNLAT